MKTFHEVLLNQKLMYIITVTFFKQAMYVYTMTGLMLQFLQTAASVCLSQWSGDMFLMGCLWMSTIITNLNLVNHYGIY